MRKLDRNAVFNISLKAVLFITVFCGCSCLLMFVLRVSVIPSVVVPAVLAFSVMFLFSYLLRYTSFYYRYYSFLSAVLYHDKQGDVYCPCCGKYFGHFVDERFYADEKRFNPEMFSGSRQDVICGFCRSAPRQRIIADWAEKHTELLKNSRILYFAPELSMMLWFERHGIRVTTADLYDSRTDLKLDITSTGLPDGSEDIVFCNHVLEHVSDHNLALAELYRIIRKGGMLVISFPIDPDSDGMREVRNGSDEDRIRICGQHDHLRVFGKDCMTMLENAGFETGVIDTAEMPESIVPVTGPADYDSNRIFCCIRK